MMLFFSEVYFDHSVRASLWTTKRISENTLFRGYLSLKPACTGLVKLRGSGHRLLKSTFNAENLIRRLHWSVSSHFGTIYF